MGKISFPLINVRKDVAGYWHQKHYTGDSAELLKVPTEANSDGYYTVFLTEVPDSGTKTDYLNTTPPTISGLVEFRGQPVDDKTKRLLLNPTQFYVNYQTGEILFHPSRAGTEFTIDYWGRGSLIEADDINYLHNRVSKLEKEHDLSEFTEFTMVGFESGILEVGESLPRADQPILIEFKWETTYPDRLKEDSIKIKNLLTDQVLGENLPNSGYYGVEFQEVFNFSTPNSLKFEISAERLNGEIVTRIFELQWVDRIYWGISPHKDITGYQVGAFNDKRLFKNIDPEQKEIIKFLDAVHHYKVIAVPKRYPLQKVIDKVTSLSFILDDPKESNVINDYKLEIPYLVYCSTYPVTSEVELICQIGEGEE